jgi:muramidase (phage lysozyme)
VRYSPKGGATFSDFSKHPNVRESVPWRTDGLKSSAAGAYQITNTTWQSLAGQYGFKDFTPATQDRAAWVLAQQDYRRKTGEDLQQTLETGNVQKVFKALSSTWTSLPSGKESNKLTGKAYDVYQQSLSVDRAVKGAQILANPLGYLSGVVNGIKPVGGVLNAAPITPDSWYIRLGYGVVGLGMLITGLVKLKV